MCGRQKKARRGRRENTTEEKSNFAYSYTVISSHLSSYTTTLHIGKASPPQQVDPLNDLSVHLPIPPHQSIPPKSSPSLRLFSSSTSVNMSCAWQPVPLLASSLSALVYFFFFSYTYNAYIVHIYPSHLSGWPWWRPSKLWMWAGFIIPRKVGLPPDSIGNAESFCWVVPSIYWPCT